MALTYIPSPAYPRVTISTRRVYRVTEQTETPPTVDIDGAAVQVEAIPMITIQREGDE